MSTSTWDEQNQRGHPGGPCPDESWNLEEYLLAGQGPTDQRVREEFLRAVGYESRAVLIPLNTSTLYGSLLLCAKRGEVLVGSMDELLIDERFLSRWNRQFRTNFDNNERTAIARQLQALFPATTFEWISTASVVERRTPRRGPDLRVVLFVDTPTPPPDELVRRLAAVLVTTIPVVSRTADSENAVVERAVRDLGSGHQLDGTTLLTRLLSLALDATRSSWGAVYSPSGAKRLERLASVNLPHLADLDVLDSAQIAARAYRQNRTFILTEPSSKLHPIPGAPEGPQLAVPIGGAARGQPFLAGVLVLGRAGGETARPFSQYDAALARNVAIRLSIQSEAHFLGETLDLFSRMQDRPFPSFDAKLHGNVGTALGIGSDLALLQPVFQAIVDQVAQHPQVDSASIRVISSKRSELVRIAIAPPDRRNDSDPRIQIQSTTSVAALSARERRPVYLPNLDKTADISREGLDGLLIPRNLLTDERRTTKSELCVPIRLNGRAVGTLNLESSRKGALATVRPFAVILAGLAGTHIQRLHRRLEQDIFDYSIRLFGAAHTLAGVGDQLRRATSFTSRDLAGFADTITRSLSLAGEVRSTDTIFHSVKGRVLVSPVIEAAFRAVDADTCKPTPRYIGWMTPPPPLDLTVSEACARALYVALTELLTNSFRRCPKDDDGSREVLLACAVEPETLQVDVRNHLAIGTRIPVSGLFNVPIHAGGREHIGALGAGVAVRAVGGDVYVADLSSAHIRVRVLIPTTDEGRKASWT